MRETETSASASGLRYREGPDLIVNGCAAICAIAKADAERVSEPAAASYGRDRMPEATIRSRYRAEFNYNLLGKDSCVLPAQALWHRLD